MLVSVVAAATLLAPPDSILLRLLAINDLHGTLESRAYGWSGGREVGGIAALKATFDRLAVECGCPTLRLDGGDQMQGSLISNLVAGRSTVDAMNLLGLDAAAVGNHDLDWGVSVLRQRMAQARYPWLVANLFDSVTKKRPPWVKGFAMVAAGPFRVAVIGLLTPQTKQIVMAERVAGLEFRAGRHAIDDVLAEVHAAHPDLTVVVAHEGAFCDTLPCHGEIVNFAKESDSTEIQAIVAGHTHTRILTAVNGIPIISAQSNGQMVGVLDLIADGSGRRRWETRVDTAFVDRVAPDSAAGAIVARYRPLVDRKARRIVARLRDSLLTRGTDLALGWLIADAQRAATGAEVAVMNRGGIRRDLYPGPLSYGTLFELQPFGNRLVRVMISGADLVALMERSLAGRRPELLPSGLVVRYDPTRPAGARVISVERPGSGPLDPARTYTLTVTDFLAGGGGGFGLNQLPNRPTSKTDLEALTWYLGSRPQPVRTPPGPRLIAVAP